MPATIADSANPSARLALVETWKTDLAQRPSPAVDWVWPGYLARGAVTLLTSQWKTGKTTLLSVLLAKMACGGELAGQTVRPARVAVASEESLDCWQRRNEKLSFGDELCFFCQPFAGRSTPAAWEALVDRLAELGRERGIDVVIFDPLATFLPPGAEGQTGIMLETLSLLTRLTRQGQAVFVLHHPAKGAAAAGQLARGCGALCASVDILMEMTRLGSALDEDRRRRIAAWSRFEETPRRRLVELSEDGCDYRAIMEAEAEDAFAQHWLSVERLLAFPPRKLSRQELLVAWRAKASAPSPATLWRVLDRAVEAKLLQCDGTGTCTDPFRYWLAELPTQWEEPKQDPAADCWPLVRHLLTCPARKLTHRQLLEHWPEGEQRPSLLALEACLQEAVAAGHLQQEGVGRPDDPKRYFIDGLGALWLPDYSELLGL